MRPLFLWSVVAFSLLSGASTVSKIKNSKKDLSTTEFAKKQANQILNKIAKNIKNADGDIVEINQKLEVLKTNKEETEKQYQQLKVELKNSEAALSDTNKEIEKKHKAFIALLSKQFSVMYAMQQFENPTENSIVSYRVYKAYKKHNVKELKSLESEISLLNSTKKNKKYKYDKTKNSIDGMIKKRELFSREKIEKKTLIAKLSEDEEKYQAQLQGLVDKQNSLRTTLSSLNILRKQEVEEARKRAEERRKAIRLEKERIRKIREEKALAKEKARKARLALKKAKTKEAKRKARLASKKAEKESRQVQKKVYKKSERVKKVNSSYNKSKIYAYRGGKTISPMPGARLIKKFGTYVDPVYKIKIFNESITLRAPSSNAKVQNVLNGKVVFAGKSSMLGKVVVVAHSGKMHTVYAGLSKIAPTISVGSKIKRGYVIGKVSKKLMFQATKNSRHINPAKLIRI